MADISQVKLPNNTTYNIKDAYKSGIYPVIGTQTAATGTWTGVLHGVSALYNGLTIIYYLPYAGSGNATLNLTLDDGTTTGAVNCYYNASRLTTHYPAGSNFMLTYYSAGSIKISGTASTDNRWIADANYNTNTNTYVTQTATTTSANYEVLFSATADNTTRTEAARKNNNLLFNPNTGNLQATQLNGVAIGTSPKFTDTNTTYSAGTGLSLSGTQFSIAIKSLVDILYPVGEIKITTSNINPGTYLTGTTWEAWGSGRMPIGVDSNNTSYDTAEETGGAASVTLSTNNLPSHTHKYDKSSDTSGSTTLTADQSGVPAHSHPMWEHTHTYDKVNSPTGGPNNNTSGSTTLTTDMIPSHTHTFTGSAVNSGVENQATGTFGLAYVVNQSGTRYPSGSGNPRYLAMTDGKDYRHYHSVTAKGSNSNTGGGKGHTHTLSSHTHTTSTTSTKSGRPVWESGDATGILTGTKDNTAAAAKSGHTHGITLTSTDSGSTGSGTAINILPPYISCYMWKRTA